MHKCSNKPDFMYSLRSCKYYIAFSFQNQMLTNDMNSMSEISVLIIAPACNLSFQLLYAGNSRCIKLYLTVIPPTSLLSVSTLVVLLKALSMLACNSPKKKNTLKTLQNQVINNLCATTQLYVQQIRIALILALKNKKKKVHSVARDMEKEFSLVNCDTCFLMS